MRFCNGSTDPSSRLEVRDPASQWCSHSVIARVIVFSVLFLLNFSGPVNGEVTAGFTGGFRGLSMISLNPDQEQLYPNREDLYSGWILRLMLDGTLGSIADYEINIVNDLSYATASPVSGAFQTGGQVSGNHRHPDLELIWRDNEGEDEYIRGVSAVDRLNVKLFMDPFEMSLGRKPVNLSTCFILTPNDFFQPFSPESFNRIYKPGVDMVKLTWYPGNLSDIGLLAVAGYNGDNFDQSRSSLLARWVFSAWKSQWMVMGGTLGSKDVITGAFQGEYRAMGLRGEFNISFPDETDFSGKDQYIQFSAGIDHYWANNLILVVEYMFRENGIVDIEDLFTDPRSVEPLEEGYLGRNYLAMSAGYEWYPLLRSDLSAVANLDDNSMILTGTLLYSISNESDFVIGGMLSLGKEPDTQTLPGDIMVPVLRSEFGSYPDSLFIEMRLYF